LLHHRWTQFDHITSVMNAYGAPYEIRAVQPDEIEGGANALNMTRVLRAAAHRICAHAHGRSNHAVCSRSRSRSPVSGLTPFIVNCCCLQLMANSDTSGKYALIIATPSNVINIWGGVLSLNQVS
jgi:hypothetical protein